MVITNKTPVRAAAIDSAPNLRMIAIAATGSDVVDIEACAGKGIVVSNIRNYAINTVPEHTFALIFALRRSIVAYRQSVRDGAWQRSGQFCYFDYPIHDLAGSTLGVIGDGVLGQAVANLGRAFGMRVLFSSYKGVSGMGPLYTPFDESCAKASDHVAPATDAIDTRPDRSGRVRANGTPAIGDQHGARRPGRRKALCEALESGQISGAGFDVATVEPPPADHPFMRLLALPNFILTPHVAWSSREAIQGLADQLIENIDLFWHGTPRNVVIP